MIEREQHNEVVILRMNHGKASALDLELSRALDKALEAEEKSSCGAVVLTGTGSIFCAGVDLYRVIEEGAPYVREFLPALSEAFRRLFFFPKPVVVAANGHAIAGGAVLLSGGDVRLIADGKARVGFPELPVGVPYPVIALESVRFAVPPEYFQEVVFTGSTYSLSDAESRGLFDERVPSDELMARSQAKAEELARVPARTFQLVKSQIRGPIRDYWEKNAVDHDAKVIASWTSPEVLGAIRAYVEKTLG